MLLIFLKGKNTSKQKNTWWKRKKGDGVNVEYIFVRGLQYIMDI